MNKRRASRIVKDLLTPGMLREPTAAEITQALEMPEVFVADCLRQLADGALRTWVEAILTEARSNPQRARVAADELLDRLEVALAFAAARIRWGALQ